MGSLLVAWVVAPVALLATCTGLSLGFGRILGRTYSPLGLVLIGFPCLISVSWLLTRFSTVATLAPLLVILVAILGFYAWWRAAGRLRLDQPDGYGAAAGLITYLVYAAPVIASGKATWTGWVKLDDTATWLSLTASIFDHQGRAAGEPASTFERVLQAYEGYPTGAFAALGTVPRALGIETAWFYQAFMAFAAALLAIALYRLLASFIASRGWRLAAAVIASQAATLYAYVLWGGVKEIVLAALLATIVLFAGQAIRKPRELRLLAAPLVGAVGFLLVSGPSGLAYLTVVTGCFGLAWIVALRPQARNAALWLVVLAVAAGIPILLTRQLPLVDSLRPDLSGDIGNLIFPLSPLQFSGIWPVGDFRLRPDQTGLTEVLIALAAALAVLGVLEALRRRSWAIPVALGASAIVAVRAQVEGQDWLAAKAMAVGSPFFLVAAFAGAGVLAGGARYLPSWLSGRRAALAAGFVVAAGVIWSNLLAYHEVWLAPRGANAEAAEIGSRYAGEGPALFTEYAVFGARYFLRESGAEAASDLRSRRVRLRDGTVLGKGEAADVDKFDDRDLSDFPVIITRRSSASSRPPDGYGLDFQGRYFDVWVRNADAKPVVSSLALGDGYQPGSVPDCGELRSFAAEAPAGSQLAYVERKPTLEISLADGLLPPGWRSAPQTGAVLPGSGGTVTRRFTVGEEGGKSLWIAGSYPGSLSVKVDGREVFAGSSFIQFDSSLLSPVGNVALDPGEHDVEISYSQPLLSPGSGANVAVADPVSRKRLEGPNGEGTLPLGPLVIGSETPEETQVRRIPTSAAAELCGRYLDWVSIVKTS